MTSQGHRDYRQPPERKSMHARIVRDLGMRIVAGEFKPGDRLPAEASLLAEYDVSRPVLREAVRVLVAKGLVLSRQRAGATVRLRSDWHLLDPDVLYWLIQTQPPPQFVETLLTARRVFEPATAALAAKVASGRLSLRPRGCQRRGGRDRECAVRDCQRVDVLAQRVEISSARLPALLLGQRHRSG